MGKVIYYEFCKKFTFDSEKKYYMHNPESVLENGTNKILCDFEIQMDNLISASVPDWVIVNKKENLRNNGPCRSS